MNKASIENIFSHCVVIVFPLITMKRFGFDSLTYLLLKEKNQLDRMALFWSVFTCSHVKNKVELKQNYPWI